MLENLSIPVYVVNPSHRADELGHIKQQFSDKTEFDVSIVIVETSKYPVYAIGFWQSIVKIIKMADQKDDDVIIICENNHEFTPDYSKQQFFQSIIGAAQQGAKILLGGIGDFGQAIPISNGRCWIDYFRGTQFMVIYRSFFQQLLDEPFNEEDAVDLKLSEMTSHKMVFYPYISAQKDFEYPDILTAKPSINQYLNKFDNSLKRLKMIYNAALKYKKILPEF